jgi:hypothetical protein
MESGPGYPLCAFRLRQKEPAAILHTFISCTNQFVILIRRLVEKNLKMLHFIQHDKI